MIVGCPKEIKEQEYRVGITPSTAVELIKNGHQVVMEKDAGVGSGYSDQDYIAIGANSGKVPLLSVIVS